MFLPNKFTSTILFTFPVLSILILCSCRKQQEKKIVLPAVMVTEVASEDLKREWEMIAQTVSDPKVDLRARVSGFIENRNFKQGSFVKKGTLLLQIEKEQYKAEVEQAEAEVSVKQAVLDNANIAFERNKKLLKANAVSKAEFDQAKADKLSADGDLRSAKAKLIEAKLDLSYTDIKAPFDGQIGLTKYSIGNLVGPDSGILATIVSLDPMKVEFNVTEGNFLLAQQEAVQRKISIEELLSGVGVRLILSDTSEYKHPGQIFFWDNQINSSTGTILMRAKFPNPDSILLPGQYVRIKIISQHELKTIHIPQAAVLSDLGGKYVLVVDDKSMVSTQRVKLGYSFDKMIVVEKGLKKGQKIITQGLQKVRPGIKVNASLDTIPKSPGDNNVSSQKSSDKDK